MCILGSGIEQLEIAPGLKDSLARVGFTVESIVLEGPDAVSVALGIEPYVGKIMYDAAKKISAQSSLVAT